jgi:hypothetical protein
VDTISHQLRALDKLDTTVDLDARDAQIRDVIYKRYGL